MAPRPVRVSSYQRAASASSAAASRPNRTGRVTPSDDLPHDPEHSPSPRSDRPRARASLVSQARRPRPSLLSPDPLRPVGPDLRSAGPRGRRARHPGARGLPAGWSRSRRSLVNCTSSVTRDADAPGEQTTNPQASAFETVSDAPSRMGIVLRDPAGARRAPPNVVPRRPVVVPPAGPGRRSSCGASGGVGSAWLRTFGLAGASPMRFAWMALAVRWSGPWAAFGDGQGVLQQRAGADRVAQVPQHHGQRLRPEVSPSGGPRAGRPAPGRRS